MYIVRYTPRGDQKKNRQKTNWCQSFYQYQALNSKTKQQKKQIIGVQHLFDPLPDVYGNQFIHERLMHSIIQ